MNTEPLLEEIIGAIDRIGSTQEGLMRWLLKFSKRDLSSLSIGDWMNLQYEVLIFEHPYYLGNANDPHWRGRLIAFLSKDPRGYPDFLNEPLPDKAFINNLKKLTIEVLGKIIRTEQVAFGVINEFQVNLRPPQPDVHKEWIIVPSSSNRHSVLQYNLATLLVIFVDKIRSCPECEVFFLADRKNQVYCSLKHQNYASVKSYRKAHGLITGKKRGRPRKKDTSKREGGS